MTKDRSFIVNRQELFLEAVNLLNTQTIPPALPGGQHLTLIESFEVFGVDGSAFGKKSARVLKATNPSGCAFYFKSFDSKWHNKNRNQFNVKFTDSNGESIIALGTEVNYYFQGVLFFIFGLTETSGLNVVRAWKKFSRHGHLNSNIRFFVHRGYEDGRRILQMAIHRKMARRVKLNSYARRNPKIKI